MPENQNIEWKSKWKDDSLEWICGYANAQGGKIYIFHRSTRKRCWAFSPSCFRM